MEVLDGDVVRLSSRGREAERDIVQVSHSLRTMDHSPFKLNLIFCKKNQNLLPQLERACQN